MLACFRETGSCKPLILDRLDMPPQFHPEKSHFFSWRFPVWRGSGAGCGPFAHGFSVGQGSRSFVFYCQCAPTEGYCRQTTAVGQTMLCAGLRSVVSHPCDKNKDVARMGHPANRGLLSANNCGGNTLPPATVWFSFHAKGCWHDLITGPDYISEYWATYEY
jgi:hypothetical protein